MKLTPAQQETLVRVMARFYDEILTLEIENHLLIGEGDTRPRIDYFHDAIRAFTNKDPQALLPGGRLTIEWLAYDVQALRYIESMPLGSLTPYAELSASTELAPVEEGLIPQKRRASREAKEQIAEGYKQYGVLFAALLKPFAETDYKDRTEQMNEEVAILGQIIKALEMGNNAAPLINHLDSDEIRHTLQSFLSQGVASKSDLVKKAINHLKQKIKNNDKEIKRIDAAHHTYVMAQLGLYEASRDILKKMAKQGMNIVGQFVEASLKESQQGRGR
jgi:hypothetical protein